MYVSGSHPIRLQPRVTDPSGSLTEATMLGGSALSIAEHSIWVGCCGLPSKVRVYAVTRNTAGSPGTLRSGRPLHHHYTDRFQKILVTSATCIALGHQSHGRVVEDRILWTCTLEERAVRWATQERRENRDFTSGCHKSNAPSPSSVNYHTSPVAREFKMKGRTICDVEGLKVFRRGSFE